MTLPVGGLSINVKINHMHLGTQTMNWRSSTVSFLTGKHCERKSFTESTMCMIIPQRIIFPPIAMSRECDTGNTSQIIPHTPKRRYTLTMKQCASYDGALLVSLSVCSCEQGPRWLEIELSEACFPVPKPIAPFPPERSQQLMTLLSSFGNPENSRYDDHDDAGDNDAVHIMLIALILTKKCMLLSSGHNYT